MHLGETNLSPYLCQHYLGEDGTLRSRFGESDPCAISSADRDMKVGWWRLRGSVGMAEEWGNLTVGTYCISTHGYPSLYSYPSLENRFGGTWGIRMAGAFVVDGIYCRKNILTLAIAPCTLFHRLLTLTMRVYGIAINSMLIIWVTRKSGSESGEYGPNPRGVPGPSDCTARL